MITYLTNQFENINFRKNHIWFLFLFFGLFYVFLPNINPSMDALDYAADAKWGNFLFHQNHLLYTFTLFIVQKLIPIDILHLGQILNGLFATGSLFILWKIILNYNQSIKSQFSLILFVGSSFATFRFATDNETYIFPVFFSLIGFYFISKSKINKSSIFLSSIFLSFACLYHQLHFFWWFGILVFVLISSRFSLKSILVYISPALIVPLAYTLVLIFDQKKEISFSNLFNFIFSSYFNGDAEINFSILGFIRFIFSLFRTFLAIHHHQIILFKHYPFLIFLALILISGIIFIIIKNRKSFYSISKSQYPTLTICTLLIIFSTLSFAFLSFGNSEFMVAIPFLIAIVLSLQISFKSSLLAMISIILLCWNISFATLPFHYITITGNKYWSQKAIENPDAYFLMTNYGEISGLVYYQTGKSTNNIIFTDANDLGFKTRIDSLLNNNIKLFTDFDNNIKVINSESILFQNQNKLFFEHYQLNKIDSITSFVGKEYLSEIKKSIL